MREAKDSGDIVEARLRAVLDGPAGDERADLAAEGGPLDWAEIIPAWSEEEPVGDGHPLERRPSGGVAGARPGGVSGGSSGRALRDPGFADLWPGPGGVEPPADVASSYPWDEAPRGAVAASIPFQPSAEDSTDPAAPGSSRAESGGLTGQGAFGGGRRAWLHAFDPGRAGVRALAAVAVAVVLIAAFLAWRARPRVDPVAPTFGETSSAEPRPPSAAAGGGTGEVVVAVGGKVRKPGLVRLAPGARVADALTAAGGAEAGVDVAMLNLARKVVDGELIMVGVSAAPMPGPGTAPGTGVPGGLVNLNTATLADLDALPGVGPVLAQRILDARDAQGGFRAVGDLRKVDGIGDARFEQLKDLVTV